jgi:DNA-directed RNA polymerase subunit F
MVKPNIVESEPMSISQVKDELGKIKKRDGELNFRANKTEEYVNHFSKLSSKKIKELYDEIDKLKIPRLKENYIHKFIDIMPLSVDDAKVILQGHPVSINNDNLKKVIGVLDKYRD